MIQFISALWTFWNYIEEVNTLKRIISVVSNYGSYIKWWFKNPEVKIKYSRLISLKSKKDTIEQIHRTLVQKNKILSDDFIKEKNKMFFEFVDSKLSYRVIVDKINERKYNLVFENKYISYYPFRNFKKLNEVTNEYNETYNLISESLNIRKSNPIIFIEIMVDTHNSQTVKFKQLTAEIIFKKNKIQINNFHGSEHSEFILYFIIKWLKEPKYHYNFYYLSDVNLTAHVFKVL